MQTGDAANQPTIDDLQDLEKLRAVIDRAVADGKISPAEMQSIKAAAWADGKFTAAEAELYATLVLEKIRTGELQWED